MYIRFFSGPSFSVAVPKSRNPSLSQRRIIGQQHTSERALSTDSTYHSDVSDGSLPSRDSSTYSNRANDRRSQFSLSQSVRSLLTTIGIRSNRVNGKNKTSRKINSES